MTVPWAPNRPMYPHRLMVTEDILERDSDDIEMLEAEIDQLQRENRGLAGDLSRAKMNKTLMLWQVCAFHEERMKVAMENARIIGMLARQRPLTELEDAEFEKLTIRAKMHADCVAIFARRGAHSDLWKIPPGGGAPDLTPMGKQIIPVRPFRRNPIGIGDWGVG